MLSRTKSELRREYTQMREAMDQSEVERLSEKIIDTILKLPVFKRAETVMVYLNFKNEVDSLKMIEESYKAGKKVVIPYCEKETMEIIPSELNDIETEIVKGKNGYLQTKKDCVKPVPIEDIDLIVVPGIAFDKRCYRLGFGAGYYDRFLRKLNFEKPTIGLCYDFQIIHSIPIEGHDVPLDFVITEERILVRP
ncbi:putative 5-formyltetrahydrofolate cyclo-ligase [Andreesenia angusta]|uniref:5-formyltetrahydrofolate cyclo-ligase n=1 Tax=Andreesenia angusta TaxID=39480 RepID=A0A1S1V5Q6_9FIRM|nr:5-formyltetrahydrofolate cyclo-ligase [Andreesenia angusta]OHW61437.1 putative 5-formyltetrahydrofolate cyclo-ligase [Andreesenia angusta]